MPIAPACLYLCTLRYERPSLTRVVSCFFQLLILRLVRRRRDGAGRGSISEQGQGPRQERELKKREQHDEWEEKCDRPKTLLQRRQSAKPARKTISSIRTDRERRSEEIQISEVAQLADYLGSFALFSFFFRALCCDETGTHCSHLACPIPS